MDDERPSPRAMPRRARAPHAPALVLAAGRAPGGDGLGLPKAEDFRRLRALVIAARIAFYGHLVSADHTQAVNAGGIIIRQLGTKVDLGVGPARNRLFVVSLGKGLRAYTICMPPAVHHAAYGSAALSRRYLTIWRRRAHPASSS